MISVFEDIRFAIRLLRKSPGFTVTAVLTMAVGIGANTAMFSVIHGVLLRSLPYEQPERLVKVSESWPEGNIGVSYLNFRDLSRLSHSFEAIAAHRPAEFNLTGSGEAERLRGRMVSADFLRTLRVRPILGRDFLESEDRRGGAPVALLSDSLWRRRFGGDPRIVGRTLVLNGEIRRIIGVVPSRVLEPNFESGSQPDVFIPLSQWTSPILQVRMYHPGIQVVARLKPGVRYAQAQAEASVIGAELAKQFPKEDGGHSVAITPLKDDLVAPVRPLLWLLQGAVGFVLLIACANVANLLLSRATTRQKEMTMRMALGANRFRVLRQLLVESLLLSLCGAAAGLALASWGLDLILKAVPQDLPRLGEIRIDGGVLAFAVAAAAATGILFGVGPALQLSRLDIRGSLAEAGRSVAGGRHRLRHALIVSEVALALVLLAGMSLMVESIWRLSRVNAGLDPHNVLLTQMSLSPANAETPARIRAAYAQLVARMERLPGVEAAALIGDVPLEDEDLIPFSVKGRPFFNRAGELQGALMFETTAQYLQVMRIPLRRGRFFTDQDDAARAPVAVIDESMAATVFRGQDPIGKRIVLGAPDQSFAVEIVGIVGHIKQWGLDERGGTPDEPLAQVYLPFVQLPDSLITELTNGATVALRTKANPLGFFGAVKREISAMDPGQPAYNPRTMDSLVANTLASRRFTLRLLAAFGLMALLLASIGMYGVISYLVSQRTREIGVRVALGAQRRDVLKLVVGRALLLGLAGVAFGAAGAALATRAISRMLFGVRPGDPATLVGVALMLLAVTLLASYLPARRAASVDPMAALHDQ